MFRMQRCLWHDLCTLGLCTWPLYLSLRKPDVRTAAGAVSGHKSVAHPTRPNVLNVGSVTTEEPRSSSHRVWKWKSVRWCQGANGGSSGGRDLAPCLSTLLAVAMAAMVRKQSKWGGAWSEPSPRWSMIYPQLSERVARMQGHLELWVREIICLGVEEGPVNLGHHIS